MEPAPVRANAHSEAKASLSDQIAAQFPDHAIAFDVVFESHGKRVDWHGASASAKFFILRPHAIDATQLIGRYTHRTTRASAPSPSTASPRSGTTTL